MVAGEVAAEAETGAEEAVAHSAVEVETKEAEVVDVVVVVAAAAEDAEEGEEEIEEEETSLKLLTIFYYLPTINKAVLILFQKKCFNYSGLKITFYL